MTTASSPVARGTCSALLRREKYGVPLVASWSKRSPRFDQRESMDLSMTFSTSLEFGQMMYGAVGHFF
jgi:hypothetical protein